MTNQDERLKGNEKIETAIAALQQEPNDELLAHTLTVIRRRMKEQGHGGICCGKKFKKNPCRESR